jgi:SOS-response transcriptional repressor LexA/DNA-binding XRE family transcriptional regulator
LRESFNQTQAEFAEKLRIPRTSLANYENGTSIPGDLICTLKLTFAVNTDWFLTGEGEMFSPKKLEKHPLIVDIEALIDQKLEKVEAQIAEIKGQINAGLSVSPDSGMFVLEPEPEYGEDEENIIFVDGIAAGRPIYQSEARSFISVPKRYIKTKPEDYYVGRIKGTSMTAAGIPDGVLVLIRISDTPMDGAIQVVERQGEATLKRMREVPCKGWKICFDDHTGRYIEIGPGDEFYIQGDFIAVLPEDE